MGGISNTRAALAPHRAGRLCTRTNPNLYLSHTYIYIYRSGAHATCSECHVLQKPVKPAGQKSKTVVGDGAQTDFFVGAMENVSSFLGFCCSVGVFEQCCLFCKQNFQILCASCNFSLEREGVLWTRVPSTFSFARAYTWRAFTWVYDNLGEIFCLETLNFVVILLQIGRAKKLSSESSAIELNRHCLVHQGTTLKSVCGKGRSPEASCFVLCACVLFFCSRWHLTSLSWVCDRLRKGFEILWPLFLFRFCVHFADRPWQKVKQRVVGEWAESPSPGASSHYFQDKVYLPRRTYARGKFLVASCCVSWGCPF